jgi:PAS domain S-box-containing protein
MNGPPVHLLLVEDNPGDARLIREQLAEAGGREFKIETVNTLADAVERCARPGIDAVLLDLGLPDSVGLETLKALRAHAPELPMVVLTGLSDETIAVQAVQAGAQDYLIKGELGGALMPRALRYAIERKHAEETLRESEEKFRAIANFTVDWESWFGSNGKYLWVNPAVEKITGYAAAEILALPDFIPVMIAEEDRGVFVERFQDALRGSTGENFEFRYLHKNGSKRWLTTSWQPIFDTHGKPLGVRASGRDITARKKTESYREMGLEILQILNEPGELQDTIQRIIAVVKTRTGFDATGLRLQDGDDFPYFTQQGFAADFLQTENSLIERDANGGGCRDKDGHVSLECTCGLVISGKTDPASPLFTRGGSFWTNNAIPLLELPAEQDPRLHPRNQCIHHGYASVALVPIRNETRIIGLLHLNDRRQDCFTLDMIELLEDIATHIGAALMRKQIEEKLRQNEARLAAAQAVAKIGSWETDLVTLKTIWSEETYRIFELVPDRFQPTHPNFMACVHPEDRTKVEAAFVESLGKHTPAAIEHRIMTPGGIVKVVEEHWQLIYDSQGKPVRALGTCQDITAHKRDELELQQLQKLQSVGTLAGGIAHDFNNILMGVFGNISLAKDELAKDHPSYTCLEEAETSMSRAVRLTKQLLTFAKGGDPVKEDVCLGALVQDVARFDLSGSPVKLVYQHPDDLWLAEVDKGQIQQVVSNLTINARQAMPNGGCLYVTLENVTLPAGAIPNLRPGKYIRGTVRDEGTGIDPKNIDRIFDPYFTTKQTGSGLGLATTYSIVNKHGGHIGVVSELGKGTTFTFHLPASQFPQAAETHPLAAPGPGLNRPARILVMDDEETVCHLVERMLTRCGFAVATAGGGQETIAMYRQAMKDGAPFDVVIMDLTIPGGIGGKDAIKELLTIDPHAKAIVSSGYADSPVMANYADYGFKGVAAKPYTPNELRNALAQVLNGSGVTARMSG